MILLYYTISYILYYKITFLKKDKKGVSNIRRASKKNLYQIIKNKKIKSK